MKGIIVAGVAGGASCAALSRAEMHRLIEITSRFVAQCGLLILLAGTAAIRMKELSAASCKSGMTWFLWDLQHCRQYKIGVTTRKQVASESHRNSQVYRTMDRPLNQILIAYVFLCAASVFGQDAKSQATVDEHYYFAKSEHQHKAEWGYTGKIGPKFWGRLDRAWSMASHGKRQSPINIVSDVPARELPLLKFDYKTENLSAFNNGHTIQHNEAPGSFLVVGDKRYALEQFHVHTPSEHTIDGRHFPMEVHFVHKSSNGEFAVVAVLVEVSDRAGISIPYYVGLPDEKGESVRYKGRRNPVDFLPKNRDYYDYSGSFTTPPCTEGVRWFVLKTPVQKDARRIQRFADMLKDNNRPVQSLNGRKVVVRTESK